MVHLQDMNESTGGDGATYQRIQLQTVLDSVNSMAHVLNNDPALNGADVASSPTEVGTNTVDPNLLAPWDPGYAGAPDENDASENPEPSQSNTDGQIDANTNESPQLSVVADVGAAGQSMEMGVGSVKKKTKSKKKPKSKRGLVQLCSNTALNVS